MKPYCLLFFIPLFACTEPKPTVYQTQKIEPSNSVVVNNPTPLPLGYQVDLEILKQPIYIDFNGDSKLDTFRILKNPHKTGLKYLYEFRITDSNTTYFYENDEMIYDLNMFGKFEVIKSGEKLVNTLKLDNSELLNYDEAPKKARVLLANDGLMVDVIEETCAASVFYLENNQIQRIFLC